MKLQDFMLLLRFDVLTSDEGFIKFIIYHWSRIMYYYVVMYYILTINYRLEARKPNSCTVITVSLLTSRFFLTPFSKQKVSQKGKKSPGFLIVLISSFSVFWRKYFYFIWVQRASRNPDKDLRNRPRDQRQTLRDGPPSNI